MFASCNGGKTRLSDAEWLIGTWESKTSKGSLYETWNRVDEHNFYAKSYYLNNSDTSLFETVELKDSIGKLFYIVSVPGQNGEKPVSFASVHLSGDSLVFENKKHDFPQRISYRKISADSLVAEVSGDVDGKNISEPFAMRKTK